MDFKEKIYNYSVEPPSEIWEQINDELDSQTKIIPVKKRKQALFFFITATAASLVVIFLLFVVFNKSSEDKNASVFNKFNQTNLSPKQIQDSINLNYKILEDIINTKDKNALTQNLENNFKEKKYLTVAGPEGQPVKISAKAATLIESADDEFPPKLVWNKKIEKWKQIMANTLVPSSTNLLDIFQISMSKDNQ